MTVIFSKDATGKYILTIDAENVIFQGLFVEELDEVLAGVNLEIIICNSKISAIQK